MASIRRCLYAARNALSELGGAAVNILGQEGKEGRVIGVLRLMENEIGWYYSNTTVDRSKWC